MIAVRTDEESIRIMPNIDTPISDNEILVMLGRYDMFENLKKKK